MEDAADAGGMVSPFEGESFAAHWNAARDDPEHAARACEAASRMTATLAMLNERLAREDASHAHSFEPVEIDIGISTGPAVIAGGLASRGRTNCAVIGANIVLAARLRTLADRYAYAVIVSAATREAASRDLAFLELDFLALGPGETPIKPYAMLGNPLTHANPKFRALATFHERIFEAVRAQQWNEARRLIDQCRKLSGASRKFYDLHLARIAWFEAHPPGGDWDGAFRAPVV
jgi:adenylate cyclase